MQTGDTRVLKDRDDVVCVSVGEDEAAGARLSSIAAIISGSKLNSPLIKHLILFQRSFFARYFCIKANNSYLLAS